MYSTRLVVTTDGSGDGTVQETFPVQGYLDSIYWTVGTFAAGVDAVLSLTNTENGADITLLTLTDADASAWYRPRYAIHDNVGVAIANEYDRMYVNGVLKLVVSSGGDTFTGNILVFVDTHE